MNVTAVWDRSGARRAESGVAFILVLTVLVGLLVLAAPFITVALNDNAVSESVIAQGQVDADAHALLEYGAWFLERTTEGAERAKGGDPAVDPRSTPEWDTEDEHLVPIDLAGDRGTLLKGAGEAPLLSRKDSRGDTWDLVVRDEQSLPNLWSAPPFLIAASLGGLTINTSDLKPEDVVIDLEDGKNFPEKNGAIFIDGERITYAARDGNTLTGCARGAPGGGRARAHKAETYLFDDRAREISMLPFKSPRAKGGWREPLDPSAAKEISLYGDGVLSPIEVDRLARDFTVTSWRVTGTAFGPAQTLTRPIDPETADLSDGFRINVRSNDGINAGTLVRISDGVNTEYGFVVSSQRRGNTAVLTLADVTKNPYAERRTAVAPMVRHPVNVNTASRDTLKRLITGVQVTGGQRNPGKQGRVTVAAAEIVADQLISNRPIKDLEQLKTILQTTSETALLLFTQPEMIAVFRNAVDANDWVLGSSTVPFCFQSYDYYRLTAAAITSDKAGTERARREVVERVRVASPGRQVLRIDSQAEFEQAIVRARDALYTTTHPNPVERINPYSQNEIPASRIPRMLMNPSTDDAKRNVFPSKTEGDVRLWAARMEGFGGYVEHFDGQAFGMPDNIEVTKITPEGWNLENGAFQLPLRDNGQRSGGGNRAGGGRGGGGGRRSRGGGAILGRTGANPLKIDMWYRPDSGGAGQTFYDLVGSDPDQRIKLSIEANGEFRAFMRDRTIERPGDELEEACVSVFRPPPGLWLPKTWYHLGMSYRGCKPEELSLWVDGMKRGEARFQSILTSSMSDSDTSFSIERADDWPSNGVCWIGREAVEFTRTGTGFQVIDYPSDTTIGAVGGNGRGRRGTPKIAHAAGEVVQLFGYSTAVESQTKTGGVAIPRGGGNLASDLGPWCFASFAMTNIVSIPPVGGAPSVQWEVHDPNMQGGDQLILSDPPAISGAPVNAFLDAFQTTGGYIIIMGLPAMTSVPPPTASLPFQAELAYYTSRTGNILQGLQAVPNPPNPDLLAGNQAGVQIQTMRLLHYLRPIQSPAWPYMCAVFPISVGLTNVTGYLTPKALQGQTQISPEYISLGVPDYDDIQQHLVEWIAYYHIDTAKKMLLCDDWNVLDDAFDEVGATLLAQLVTPQPQVMPAHQIGRDELGMRGQQRTDIFGFNSLGGSRKIHTTNEDVTPTFKVVTYPGVGFLPLPANSPPGAVAVQIASHPAPGWGDSVTLETANASVRKRFDVTWSNGERVSIGEAPGQDFSQRQIPNLAEDQRDQYLRLLKFPSGEMPRILAPAKGRAGGDTEGGATSGILDEIRVAPFQSARFIVWDHGGMGLNSGSTSASVNVSVQGISETANEIPVANEHWYIKGLATVTGTGAQLNTNLPTQVVLPDGRGVEYDAELDGFPNADAGLVQIDDEIIAFRRIGRGAGGGPALLDCDRGVMNTTPSKHGFGTNLVFLDFVPTTMMSEVLNPTASVLNIASEAGFANTGGLVLINRELVHYTEIRGRSFVMPPVLDEKGEEQGGLFRGRFGTLAARHDTESIIIDMPFRYWDRYAESQDNPEISFYQVGVNRPGAWFDRFGYEEYRESQNVQIVTLVRTEADVPWCTDPARASPKLFRFDGGLTQNKGLHPIGRHGTALEARFYVRYLSNSFDPITLTQHDWKSTPELRWAQIEWFDESQVLTRETSK